MAEKPSDEGDRNAKPEQAVLKTVDAQDARNAGAADLSLVEKARTNTSDGSLRKYAGADLADQEDSVSIDFGSYSASRKSGLTEKEIIAIGSKTYDAQAVLAYNPEPGNNISDATNATGVQENQQYEQDKSKILAKPVEVQPSGVQVTGLDYNTDNVPPSSKLFDFAQSATARLISEEGRQEYFQGQIDKVLGIGEGLNLAKEEVKTSTQQAVSKAWTALQDGSVSSFMAQPNAVNDPLFRTIGQCLDTMKRDPNAVNNVLAIMGRELDEANRKYDKLAPHDRGVQTGKAMFFFFNPTGSTESQGIRHMTRAEAITQRVEQQAMHMPEVPPELKHLELQNATPELITGVIGKGRRVEVVMPGSSNWRYLERIGAEANAGGPDNFHILIKPNASKIAVLEEFLHGTQKKLGIIDATGPEIAEVRVKDFMLRHQKLLGLTENDSVVLKSLKQLELERAQRRGFTLYEIEEKRWLSLPSK